MVFQDPNPRVDYQKSRLLSNKLEKPTIYWHACHGIYRGMPRHTMAYASLCYGMAAWHRRFGIKVAQHQRAWDIRLAASIKQHLALIITYCYNIILLHCIISLLHYSSIKLLHYYFMIRLLHYRVILWKFILLYDCIITLLCWYISNLLY